MSTESGLGTSQKRGGNNIFLSIVGSNFAQRVSQATDKTQSRKLTKGPNEGQEVHEMLFGDVTGLLVGINKKENKGMDDSFAFSLNISTEKNPNQKVIIEMPCASSYASAILRRLPTIDFNKKITIFIANITDKETKKPKTILWLEQDEVKVSMAFTKENPNGLPELEMIKVKGKDVWDSSKQIVFFEELIKKYESEGKLNKIQPATTAVNTQVSTTQNQGEDLPF